MSWFSAFRFAVAVAVLGFGTSTISHAKGTDVGNGGQVIVLPDGRIVLADPYIVVPSRPAVKFKDFDPNIRAEIDLVGRLLVRLGAEIDESVAPSPPTKSPEERERRKQAESLVRLQRKMSRTGQARFVTETIASPLVDYFFVDELPSSCHAVADDLATPEGGKAVMFGCNVGNVVYFRSDLFKGVPVRDGDPTDPRDQVSWIIHERLHAINNIDGHDHWTIYAITQGIDVLLDLYRAQQKGLRPILTDEQVSKLETLVQWIASFRGLTEMGDKNPEFLTDWQITKQGGGLVHKSVKLAAGAYVGVGSMLGEDGSAESGAELMNSSCFLASCMLSSQAQVQDSVFVPRATSRPNAPDETTSGAFKAVIGVGARVLRSRISPDVLGGAESLFYEVKLEERTSIMESSLIGMSNLRLAPGAIISKTSLTVEVPDSVPTWLELEEGSSLSGLQSQLVVVPSGEQSATKRMMSLPRGTSLDFAGQQLCESPMIPKFKESLKIDTVGALKATCSQPR